MSPAEPARPPVAASGSANPSVAAPEHPGWCYNLGIYEVNLRQFSEEGTFAAFAEHLPRLKDMGVGILWFMPLHPIGVLNRKGGLGSYYSVRDYLALNPEHGDFDEFRNLVDRIHEMEMYVLIDWVANHSAWDNPLAVEHPEWYTRDTAGNFVPPVPDWSDVIDFDYDSPGLRRYMTEALRFWIERAGVDGYRCDVAGMVPVEFWNAARPELQRLKPVFMLAEWETPELHERAFDATYSWELYRAMNGIAAGAKGLSAIDSLLSREAEDFPPGAIRLRFTSNHDENSWNGTVFERLGPGAAAFAVLSFTVEGMPLIYGGQEAGLDRRLQFFDKDPIEWREHPFEELYSGLLALKRRNPALWHGGRGGGMRRILTDRDPRVYAFVRELGEHAVLAVLNLSSDKLRVTFGDRRLEGRFREVFRGDTIHPASAVELELEAWDYRVYER